MEAAKTTRPTAFLAWAVVGFLWTVAILGIASIGVFVAPVAIVATAAASGAMGRKGLIALPVAAVLTAAALLVPFMASGQQGERAGVSSAVPPPSAP